VHTKNVKNTYILKTISLWKRENLILFPPSESSAEYLFLSAFYGSTMQKYIPRNGYSQQKSQDASGAFEWLSSRRINKATGKVDPADVAKAMQQVKSLKMLKNTKSLNMSWNEMGPG